MVSPQNVARKKKLLRQTYRTDLLALCTEVLGYKDVSAAVHGPIIDAVQKFPGGEDTEVATGEWEYRPFREIRELEGSRRLLVLYPRGHLKTTIVTIAHTIQWIINYPDVRILISTATGDQAQKIMREIRGHFQFNPYFRFLFPEFCPPDEKSADFGSLTEFTVPCRRLHRKEPTVWTCSVGKVIAGSHPDVIKNSDLVDKENVKTPGGINEVISHFRFLNPLLERYDGTDVTPASTGWNDVEGTRYDFGDLYGQLMKSPDWKNVVRSAYHAEGAEKGEPIWKTRFSKEELEKSRREMGEWEFSAQFLNKCIPVGDGLCDPRDVAFVPVEVIRGIMPTLRLHCTVDLSGMEDNRKGDWTVLTVGGFDRDGRLYIIDVRCGRYSPETVIEHIFDIHKRYPAVIDYKIEKEAHARVLLPFLQREMSKRQKFPVIYPIKRDTHTSKQHRIRGLRPWFKTGIIRFSQDIPLSVKQELLDEIAHFPSQSSGVHDDILDTLADMMQNAEGGVTADVVADPPDMKTALFGLPKPQDRFLGFGEDGTAQWLYGNDDPKPTDRGRGMTGL